MAVATLTHDPLDGRQRVLNAAAERFVAQGYAATTLRQIAADVGIKAGSIYHHFPSKDALFAAVLEDGVRVMESAFEGAETHDQSADLLQAHVRAHLGALFEHGPFTAAHVTAFFTAPQVVREAIVPVRDRYERLWNTLLGQVLPELEPLRRPVARLLLFGAMNSTIEWFDPAGDLTLDELAQLITEHFLHGVRA